MLLQSHDFVVIHRKGSLNQDADALSRLSNNQEVLEPITTERLKTAEESDTYIQAILQAEIKAPFRSKAEYYSMANPHV
jgi:hypothetical protein